MAGVNSLPVRSPLDMLQFDFPYYRVFMHSVGDRLFYMAEAVVPHVQPRFVQAETAAGCGTN